MIGCRGYRFLVRVGYCLVLKRVAGEGRGNTLNRHHIIDDHEFDMAAPTLELVMNRFRLVLAHIVEYP